MVLIGVVFAGAWLAEIVLALVHGHAPASVAGADLFTNPVHVLDLSIVLPAHLFAGLSLLRRRPIATILGRLILAFGCIMSSSIAAMTLVMHLRGLPAPLPIAVVMSVLALLYGAILGSLLANLEPSLRTPGGNQ